MADPAPSSPLGPARMALRAPALAVEEQAWTPKLYLEGPRPGPSLPAAGRYARIGGAVLLPTGPDIFLLVGDCRDVATLSSSFDLAVDVSDAWLQLAISGAAATGLLAKGSAIDLHPAQFPPGACAAAGFARLRTILWRLEAARFDLLVARSHARSLWEWLADATAEYGCLEQPAEG